MASVVCVRLVLIHRRVCPSERVARDAAFPDLPAHLRLDALDVLLADGRIGAAEHEARWRDLLSGA